MKNMKRAALLGGAVLLCGTWVGAQVGTQTGRQGAKVDALHTRQFFLPGDEELEPSGSERDKIVKRLANELQSLIDKKELDKRYGAPFHRTVNDIGKWRGEQAVALLVPLVEFRLDPNTFPPGERYPDHAFYPVAVALAEIGGKEVRQAVLQELAGIKDDKKQRLCVWVLQQSEGKEWVETILSTAAKNAQTEKAKQNLEAALKLLHEPMLLPPFHA